MLRQDSSGTTLMDLITADPAAISSTTPSSTPAASTPAPSSSAASPGASLPTALGKPTGEKKSKRAALMQIQNDTISAAKAALNPVRTNIMPSSQRQKKKVELLTFVSLSPIFILALENSFSFSV